MDKNEYIEDVLANKWMTINNQTPVNGLRWSTEMKGFLVMGSKGLESLYSYEDFFKTFVMQDTPYFWNKKPRSVTEQNQRVLAGWLTLLNGMSIFEAYKQKGKEPISNETVGLSHYVMERCDDVNHAVNNSIVPPWFGEQSPEDTYMSY